MGIHYQTRAGHRLRRCLWRHPHLPHRSSPSCGGAPPAAPKPHNNNNNSNKARLSRTPLLLLLPLPLPHSFRVLGTQLAPWGAAGNESTEAGKNINKLVCSGSPSQTRPTTTLPNCPETLQRDRWSANHLGFRMPRYD